MTTESDPKATATLDAARETPAPRLDDRSRALCAILDRAGFDLLTRRAGNAAIRAAVGLDGVHATSVLAGAERAGRLPGVSRYLAAMAGSFAMTGVRDDADRSRRRDVIARMLASVEEVFDRG